MQTSKIKLGDQYAVNTYEGVRLVTITAIVNVQERTGTTNTMTGYFHVIGDDGEKTAVKVKDIAPKDIIEGADAYKAAEAEKERVAAAHEAKRQAVKDVRDRAGLQLAIMLGIVYITGKYDRGVEYDRSGNTPYVFGDGDGLELNPAATAVLGRYLDPAYDGHGNLLPVDEERA